MCGSCSSFWWLGELIMMEPLVSGFVWNGYKWYQVIYVYHMLYKGTIYIYINIEFICVYIYMGLHHNIYDVCEALHCVTWKQWRKIHLLYSIHSCRHRCLVKHIDFKQFHLVSAADRWLVQVLWKFGKAPFDWIGQLESSHSSRWIVRRGREFRFFVWRCRCHFLRVGVKRCSCQH